jgi:hypothetical protein
MAEVEMPAFSSSRAAASAAFSVSKNSNDMLCHEMTFPAKRARPSKAACALRVASKF